MPTYLTPGVYYERVDASPPAIGAIRTDIAGFAGIAECGPLDMAVPIESWRQFQAIFGDFIGGAYLAYTVRAFFENGGRRCWVVRIASRNGLGGAQTAAVTLQDANSNPVWQIAAFSPGTWGNAVQITVQEIHYAQTLTIPGPAVVSLAPAVNPQRPDESPVVSIAGFERAQLVRLTQAGNTQFKVVSDVDAVTGSLVWVHEQPAARLPYDAPLVGFDPNQPVAIDSIEYRILVQEPAMPVAVYDRLALVPESPRYGPAVMPPFALPDTAIDLGLLPPPPLPLTLLEQRTLPLDQGVTPLQIGPSSGWMLSGGTDGLQQLTTYDFIGEVASIWDGDNVAASKRRGIRVLADIEEIFTVAVPDIQIQPELPAATASLPQCVPDPCLPSPPKRAQPTPSLVPELPPVFTEDQIYQVQSTLVQLCETLGDRIALIEPPISAAQDQGDALAKVRAWRSRFDSSFAAMYYPWVQVVDPLRTVFNSLVRAIPPSGHVAGQYANTDFTIGVYKAPANSPLQWVQSVTYAISDAIAGILNPLGIDAIRTFPGRGIRIFGARTVSSDPDWLYVNVRRLMLMIEKSIDLSLQWAVFEPNTDLTRLKISLALNGFLLSLWQQGALAGGSAQAAYYIKCDAGNNPPANVANGMLLAEVGVAPSQPFEFIVLRIGRVDNSFEIAEQ